MSYIDIAFFKTQQNLLMVTFPNYIFSFFKGPPILAKYLKTVELLRLRVKQKALQLPLFYSFCSSLQQIWTD